ncbi:MAG: RNA polymerase subunit sigma-70 [Robiginitomaculum sp.]|nr:MAG: RNA polymerase subunit sigma-70 [Robiginitomaculum sp.]
MAYSFIAKDLIIAHTRPMLSDNLKTTYMAQRANLCRFLAARLRDDAIAEDLVQELWVKLSKANITEKIDNPVSYLFTMAGRLSLDHIRQRQRRVRRDEKWTDESTETVGGFATSAEDDGETRLIRAERIAKVRDAIDTLPPKAKKAFQLHRMQGMSHKEVAAVLGISVSTVEKHIIRAMRELTQILREAGP